MDSTTGSSSNAGSSWSDAFESILDWWSLGNADGDLVYVSSRHTETYTTSTFGQTRQPSSGSDNRRVSTKIVSVEFDTTTFETMDDGGGLFTVVGNATNFGHSLLAAGLKSTGGYFRALGAGDAGTTVLYKCKFLGGASGNFMINVAAGKMTVIDSEINTNSSKAVIPVGAPEKAWYSQIGGALSTSRSSTTDLIQEWGSASRMEFCGVAFETSDNATTIQHYSQPFCRISLNQCSASGSSADSHFQYSAGSSNWQSSSQWVVDVVKSGSGTATAEPRDICLRQTAGGAVSQTSSVYLAASMADGTSYAWEGVSNSSANRATSLAFPIIRFPVASSDSSVTVEVAHGSGVSLEADIYAELVTPSESSPATHRGAFRTTRPSGLADGSALTSSTSGWSGTYGGERSKLEFAVSPSISGVGSIQVFLTKPSETIFVCPDVVTT